jgi:hypothetical protein
MITTPNRLEGLVKEIEGGATLQSLIPNLEGLTILQSLDIAQASRQFVEDAIQYQEQQNDSIEQLLNNIK